MTDPPEHDEHGEERPGDDDPPESAALRALVKRSLAGDTGDLRGATPDLLAGVQKRIRRRSRGKFFADGWSVAQARTSYVLVALVTLVLAALVFLALGPMDVR
jgi:hypothetical protein